MLHPTDSNNIATPIIRRASWKQKESRPTISVPIHACNIDSKRNFKGNQEDSLDSEDLDEEWDENCAEMKELNNTWSDTGYVSCEEKDQIFLTESSALEYDEPIHSEIKEHEDQSGRGLRAFSEYPIKNLVRGSQQRHNESWENKKSSPKNKTDVNDGWHGPVIQKTRHAPKKFFGILDVCQTFNSKPTSRRNSFSKQDDWIEIPIQRL